MAKLLVLRKLHGHCIKIKHSKNIEKDLYPNLHVLLLLAATIPVTSCELVC